MLLDLNDPSKIIGKSDVPLIAPETYWETDEGCRTNVIFPGGMILEDVTARSKYITAPRIPSNVLQRQISMISSGL